MAQNDASRLLAIAALAVLTSACAMNGAPAAIPADEVIATPVVPHDEVQQRGEFHGAGIGADQLRGHLATE